MKNIVYIISIFMLLSQGLVAQTPVYLVKNNFAEELFINHQEAVTLNDTKDTLVLPGADRIYKRATADFDSITFSLPAGMLLSYHLVGQADINAFNPTNKTIGNLTISGPGVNYLANIQVSGGLERVKGILTIENVDDAIFIGADNVTALFGALIKCDSSIIIRNCPNLNNSNSFNFSSQPVINGDLILENLPALPFNWGAPGGISSITEIKGDFVMKNCNFNAFSLAALKHIHGNLHIEGAKDQFYDMHEAWFLESVGGNIEMVNNQVFNSFSGLEHLVHIAGDLYIKDCPRFGSFYNSALTSIDGDFHIENSGTSTDLEKLYDFTSITGLETIGGNVYITSNDYMNSLGGLEKLSGIGGDVSITMNGNSASQIPVSGLSGDNLPGFCLIKDFIDGSIIDPDATVTLSDFEGTSIDVSALTSCTPPPKYPSFTVSTQADVTNFVAIDTIMNLTILNFEAYPYLDALGSKIDVIAGVLTIEGGTDNQATTFFSNVIVDSTIIVKNTTNMNINNFQPLTKIKGDLILENNPGMGFHWAPNAGFQNIDTIKGSLKLINCGDFGNAGGAFDGLKYIGADFVVDSCGYGTDGYNTLWDLHYMAALRTIGGNLLWKENPNLNNLGGFQFITSIGGDVTIIDHPTSGGAIPDGVDGLGNPGFCAVKDAFDAGIIKPGATITLTRQNGTNVDISLISNCGL